MLEPHITIYDRSQLNHIPWPDNSWGRLEKKAFFPFLSMGPERLIDNVKSEFLILSIDDIILPALHCEPYEGSTYLCSPYNHFISYAYDELAALKTPSIIPLIKSSLYILRKILRSGEIDKNISVNNWLLPTNLYPSLSEKQIEAATQFLTQRYPDHAIVFRSINAREPSGLMSALSKQNYTMVPSRMIYFTDTKKDHPFKSRMFKSDLKVLNNSRYILVEDVERLKDSVPRILELYYELNIEKYSKYNPQFNEAYIRHALETGWMTMKAFECDGSIDAVLGYIETDHVITSPFFGYDLSRGQDKGLYRLISTQLLLDARAKGKLLHQSAGAGHYKKLRRAEEEIEYMAVYCEHLPLKRRFAWKMLSLIMNTIGTHFLRKI